MGRHKNFIDLPVYRLAKRASIVRGLKDTDIRSPALLRRKNFRVDELPRSKLRGSEGPSCERFPFRHPGIF